MHIIPDTQIVKPTEQWSPYPTGRDATQATAWENLLSGIPRDVSYFDVETHAVQPGVIIPSNVRFGEPIAMYPVVGFVGPCAEGNRALVRLSVSREQAAKIEEGTKPISMGFTPAICEDSAIMRARDWLESDGIPEAIGTDDEDTKPCAPRASEPIYPGQSLAW